MIDRSATGRQSRRRGRERELRYLAYLEAKGWYAKRVDGEGDIVAAKDGITLLLQVKSTAGGPWQTFGPDKRRALTSVCDQTGWFAVLVWWPPGIGQPRDASVFFSWDFPDARAGEPDLSDVIGLAA